MAKSAARVAKMKLLVKVLKTCVLAALLVVCVWQVDEHGEDISEIEQSIGPAFGTSETSLFEGMRRLLSDLDDSEAAEGEDAMGAGRRKLATRALDVNETSGTDDANATDQSVGGTDGGEPVVVADPKGINQGNFDEEKMQQHLQRAQDLRERAQNLREQAQNLREQAANVSEQAANASTQACESAREVMSQLAAKQVHVLGSTIQALEEQRERLIEMRPIANDCPQLALKHQRMEEEINWAEAVYKQFGRAGFSASEHRGLHYVLGCGVAFAAVGIFGLCLESRKQTHYLQGSYVVVHQDDLYLQDVWFATLTIPYVVVFVVASVVIPVLGAPTASCMEGMLWEFHAAFLCIVLVGKMLEFCIYYCLPVGPVGLGKFAMKFVTSVLAIVDTYTDICFIVVARACGSQLWVWALVFVILGVCAAQYIFFAVIACSSGCGGDSLKNDKKAAYCFLAKLAHFDIIVELDARDAAGKAGSDPGPGIYANCLMSVARLIAEDLAQCVIQVVFVCTMGKNPQVIISIVCSLLSSIASALMACYQYTRFMLREGKSKMTRPAAPAQSCVG